jgi:hypothetical protein
MATTHDDDARRTETKQDAPPTLRILLLHLLPFVQIQNMATGELSRYLSGVVGSLQSKHVLDNADEFFAFPVPTILEGSESPQTTDGMVYDFTGENFPSVLWRQAFGTPVLRVDLVPSTFTLNATSKRGEMEKRGFFGWIFKFLHGKGSGSGGTFDGALSSDLCSSSTGSRRTALGATLPTTGSIRFRSVPRRLPTAPRSQTGSTSSY